MQQMSGEQVKKQQFLLSLCGEMMYLINKLISYLHLMGNNSLHKLHFNYFEIMLIEAAVRLLPESR